MLKIFMKRPVVGVTYPWTLYLRADWPTIDARYIDYIEVTDEELSYVRAHFANIPMYTATTNHAMWFGDNARFIVANMTIIRYKSV